MIITVKYTYTLHRRKKKGAMTFCSRLLFICLKNYTSELKCSAFTFYTNQSIDYVNGINVRRKIKVFPSNF